MDKLIWSPGAAEELENVCNYIAKDSEYYALHFAREIIALIESIPDFPMSGRIVPEYNRKDLREKIFQNYRIVYRIKEKSIEIVAISHGARLLSEIE